MGALNTGPRRSCYSDTGMLAMPLSKVVNYFCDYKKKSTFFFCIKIDKIFVVWLIKFVDMAVKCLEDLRI